MNKIVKRVPLWGKITLWRGILTIMRIFILFICIGLSSVYANLTNAQTKMDINVKGVTLEELFKEIQEKSEFVFFYKDDVLNSKKRISLRLKNANVVTILDSAFSNTDLDDKIDDRQVVVKKKIEQLHTVTLVNSPKIQGFDIT
ncbi:MAG: STN domain-containing protein, partial [Arenibacter algicola]|nr:STN domain-containing protein [Arenibacter algicola]